MNTLDLARDAYRRQDYAAAERLCRKAPRNSVDALLLRGASLLAMERDTQAIDAFRRALEISAEPAAHHNLATALDKVGRHADAVPHYLAAIEAAPNHAAAMAGLGNALRCMGKLDDAAEWQRRALEKAPNAAPAHYQLAVTLSDAGDYQASEQTARRALTLQPDYPDAQFLLAELCLRSARWSEGWNRYENRFRLPSRRIFNMALVPAGLQPWNGGAGPVLLIHEQGFGDTIFFARFVQQLAARGLQIDAVVPRELAVVIGTVPGIRRAMTRPPKAGEYAGWLPFGSLPLALGGISTDTSRPYLGADQSRADAWRRRFSEIGPGKKVGIVWAGSPGHVNDRNRSIPAAALSLLDGAPGIAWISLQIGHPPPPVKCNAVGADLADFGDTAAALAAMDMLVSVDTSVLNLAGALGVPALGLLGTPTDWRWGQGDGPAPAYPSVTRLCRPAGADWTGVLNRVINTINPATCP